MERRSVAADSSKPKVPPPPRAPTSVDYSKVRKNPKGGVMITPEEIQAAFEFLDADKEGRISMSQLKKRLQIFFPHMTTKEYRFLMNNKRDLSVTDLTELLVDNDITGFDPVYEAFKAYDTESEGFIPESKLREIFAAFGLGEVSSTELEILTRVADVDGDGVISLEDFRYMLEMHKGNIKGPEKNNNQNSAPIAMPSSSPKKGSAPGSPRR